jgi:hypothetical protein
MAQQFENDMTPLGTNPKESRSGKYTDANDRLTEMTDMEICMRRLEEKGYTTQYRVEENKLVNLTTGKKYKADDVLAANFFRFEGISNPDDMSILYAIETTDGNKGTLVDAFGLYSDDDTGEFMKEVEIHKKVSQGKLD